MTLSDKNILLISPEPWDHIHVSKHHYAIHMAEKGNRVFFLNPPKGQFETIQTEHRNLTSVNYKAGITGLRYFPKFIRKRIELSQIKKIEKTCGVIFNVIWSFDNSVFFDFDAFPTNVLTISHIVDLNQNFQMKRASGSADVCIGVTDEIVEQHQKYNQNTFKVGHGLSLKTSSIDESIVLPGASSIKALYLGNLAMKHIDWEIILLSAKKMTQVDFVFIGPNGDELDMNINSHHTYKAEFINLPNTFFLPKIPSEQIQSYLAKADVLLLAYQEKFHRDQTNAHKILEYLLSGKPIIATYTKEFANTTDLIIMNKANSQWIENLHEVTQNLLQWSSHEMKEKRISFAMKNSYESKLIRIEGILSSMGF